MKTRAKANARAKNWFFTPFLAPLMLNRRIIGPLAVMTALQVGLTAAGVPGWLCPLNTALGVPCPACGLTRATLLLVQGDWQSALDLHAFAPIFLGIGIFLVVASVLPARLLQMAAYQTANLERHTGMAAVFGFSFMFYWILRIFNPT